MLRHSSGAPVSKSTVATVTGEAPSAARNRSTGPIRPARPNVPIASLAAVEPVATLGVRRPLGDTGHALFPVVLGTAALGTRVSAEQSLAVLDRYTAWGGNALTTSASDAGADQEVVGRWMRARRNRSSLVVTARLGAADSPRALVQSVEGSLRRLRTDHLDVLAVRPDGAGRLDELLSAVEVLLARGAVRSVVASAFTAEQLFEARVLAGLGLPRFAATEVRYSLLEHESVEGDLALVAAGQGLSLLSVAPLAHGFLAGALRRRGRRHRLALPEGDLAARFLDRRGRRTLAALDAISGELSALPAAVALAWLLTRPHVTASVIDAESVDEVDAVVRAAALGLDHHHLAALDRARR